MIMDADGQSSCKARLQSGKGQSLLEFLLLLPVLLVITSLLVKVNTTIQMGIVNQQYSRSQTLWLAFNSPNYPALRFREDPGSGLTATRVNQMILGVSDNLASGGGYLPEAMAQTIVRPGAPSIGNNDNHEEPRERGKVRIRNTVSLCTQSNVIEMEGNLVPYRLIGESAKFHFCRSLYP